MLGPLSRSTLTYVDAMFVRRLSYDAGSTLDQHRTNLSGLCLVTLWLTLALSGPMSIHDCVPISIFLDLSKAFNTLDHVILLQKLNYYGMKSVEQKKFQDYLQKRTQYVSYDKTNSDMYRISTGVPQGSILGPLLFIIYINDLCNASKMFKMIIYADDTTLYSTLDVFGNYFSKNFNLELTKVADWLKLNKLSINIKKSKFMVFHMPQKQVNIPNIQIENSIIEFSDEFTFLGLTIHKHIKWDSHINKIASKIFNSIGIMYRLKHMVPSEKIF